MRTPLSRLSLLWKILLSTSVAITLLFAITGWMVVNYASRATAISIQDEVQNSLQVYQSLWKSREVRLASISSILSAMSDVRAAFFTGDEATIRDTAGEMWSRVSDEDAIFLVTTPGGRVIASLGGLSRESLPRSLQVVPEVVGRFPAQVSGFLARGDQLFHITITPVYIQATGGNALFNVLVTGYAVNRNVAASLKSATGGSEFLFLSRGRVVAATLPPAEAAGIANQLSGSYRTVRAGGSEYAPLITPLSDVNGAAVGQLAILRSFDAANREIAGLRRNISLLWLLSMVAGLSLTYIPARRVIGPVKELDRAASEVARENYHCEVGIKSEDELGRLATTFNAMLASIRKGREELIRSERIATIGRLATSIVHDLRNPLAAIYGGAEMLIDAQLSQDQVRRLAGNMFRASLHVQQLLQDLLDLSRGKVGQMKPCNLRELVSGVADSLAARAEGQSVKFILDVPATLDLPLEKRRVERVFLNLMTNALEAMSDGGTLKVSANSEPDSVVVYVSDTGPGIAPEIRSRLFQPFITVGKSNGLGLGLALARQTIMDHGGEMWLLPDGPGACFAFRLPASNGRSHESTPA